MKRIDKDAVMDAIYPIWREWIRTAPRLRPSHIRQAAEGKSKDDAALLLYDAIVESLKLQSLRVPCGDLLAKWVLARDRAIKEAGGVFPEGYHVTKSFRKPSSKAAKEDDQKEVEEQATLPEPCPSHTFSAAFATVFPEDVVAMRQLPNGKVTITFHQGNGRRSKIG